MWLEKFSKFLLRFKLSHGKPEISVYQKSAENVRRSPYTLIVFQYTSIDVPFISSQQTHRQIFKSIGRRIENCKSGRYLRNQQADESFPWPTGLKSAKCTTISISLQRSPYVFGTFLIYGDLRISLTEFESKQK